ncbi:pyridine nucleotide-disulfide oxidoreductase [Paraglaciecola sp. MB-3u-78]|uniref:pyridine nucleotide-disulfide oxidoreductase n=1 Tax=Paraglaciecola sp. MB-3u-78 TaxID=2058332 RepID=UPI000C327852|nr:pyridine nucleotide-disulfide oxidoreductase [Paraglaciecola sp. MB-3u-78]PKG99129.1 pyridine nucleotide-disulfide oxidoreductase [Paraglaciecola sp. MB-3u-78]
MNQAIEPSKRAQKINADKPKAKINLPVVLFSILILLLLYFGWQIRDEYFITAQSGLGYALGIVGGSMMLLLLIYPLRKRFYNSRLLIFSTRNWFRIHMMLGILGPLLVLFHCNFSMGSTNSNITLASMLLMVSSGLFGRFIYGKIHYGLYGNKIQLKELLHSKILAREQIDDAALSAHSLTPEQLKIIQHCEQKLQKVNTVLGSLSTSMSLSLTTRFAQRRIKREMKTAAVNTDTICHLLDYLQAVRKIANLAFYERLFSLWHLLHMPIFFMLVITGFVHVYAVHRY